MCCKTLAQNLGSQNLTAFIQNLTFNFARHEIARGRKILRAIVSPLIMSNLFYSSFKGVPVKTPKKDALTKPRLVLVQKM